MAERPYDVGDGPRPQLVALAAAVYVQRADRKIPVMVLTPASEGESV